MSKSKKMKSYEVKSRGLFLVFITIPILVVTTSLILGFLNDLNHAYKFLILTLFFFLEYLLFRLITKDLSGFLSEEINLVNSLNYKDMNHQQLKQKIEKIFNANECLTEILQEIIKHDMESENNIVKYNQATTVLESESNSIKHQIKVQEKIDDALIDLTSQFLIQVDPNGIIEKINKSFSMRLGYNSQDLMGKNLMDLIDIEDIPKGLNSKSFLEKSLEEPVFISMKMNAKNQSAKEYISLKSSKLSNEHLLCIGKAINDEISLQSNILRKNRELEYINQINSALISNWDIEALLDNIIKRIDHLFNIKMGGIYILNDGNEWDLKSYASKTMTKSDVEGLSIVQYFDHELIKDASIKNLEIFTPEYGYLILSPLKVENDVIAIMAIFMSNEMSNNDLNILKMFKNQASMVIQRAIIYDQLRKQYFGTVEALVNVIEAKDKYTEGHSRRVSRFAVEIAKEMGYSNEEIENIEIAGLLHDVGKIGIDQNILGKRGKLTEEEYLIIKEHPSKGVHILEAIAFDDRIKDAIKFHHLRFDLKGYPKSSLEKQPLYASIIEIADAFDAITSARSYSKAKTKDDALLELIKHKGTQFAPDLVNVFEHMLQANPEKIQNIIDDFEVVHLN